MRDRSRKIAVGGMMTALAVAVMLLGGVIPAATFCCPALAGLLLLPVMEHTDGEFADKWRALWKWTESPRILVM